LKDFLGGEQRHQTDKARHDIAKAFARHPVPPQDIGVRARSSRMVFQDMMTMITAEATDGFTYWSLRRTPLLEEAIEN
jgi:hypothetical protein